MPCNTIVVNTVDLGNVGDPALLERALREHFGGVVTTAGAKINTLHGSRPQVSSYIFTAHGKRVALNDGVARSTLPEATLQAVVGEVKQAYSRLAVQTAAARFGWTVQATGPDPNAFRLVKG